MGKLYYGDASIRLDNCECNPLDIRIAGTNAVSGIATDFGTIFPDDKGWYDEARVNDVCLLGIERYKAQHGRPPVNSPNLGAPRQPPGPDAAPTHKTVTADPGAEPDKLFPEFDPLRHVKPRTGATAIMGKRSVSFTFDAELDSGKPFESEDASYTVEIEQDGYRATFVGVPTFERDGNAIFRLDNALYFTVKPI